MKLSDLDLHPNVVAALGREGLVNVSDVENMTEEELDAIDGVGLSSARVIVDGVEQWKKDRREPEESLDSEPPEPVHERREGEEEGPVGVLPEGEEGVEPQVNGEAHVDEAAPGDRRDPAVGRSMTEEEEREADHAPGLVGGPPPVDGSHDLLVDPDDSGKDEGEAPNLSERSREEAAVPVAAEDPVAGDPSLPAPGTPKSAETLVIENDGSAHPATKPMTGGLPWSTLQLQHICALDREMGRIMDRPAFNYVNGVWQGHGTVEQLAKANGFPDPFAAREAAEKEVRRLFEHFSLLRARDLL